MDPRCTWFWSRPQPCHTCRLHRVQTHMT